MSKKNDRAVKKAKSRPFYDWEGHRYFVDGNICALDKAGKVAVRYQKGEPAWVLARAKLSDATAAAKKAREAKEVELREKLMAPMSPRESLRAQGAILANLAALTPSTDAPSTPA